MVCKFIFSYVKNRYLIIVINNMNYNYPEICISAIIIGNIKTTSFFQEFEVRDLPPL